MRPADDLDIPSSLGAEGRLRRKKEPCRPLRVGTRLDASMAELRAAWLAMVLAEASRG